MLEQVRTRDLLAEYAGATDMAKSHKVTFQKSGITVDVAEDEYILEEAEDAGLHLPYDCRSGTCTTCIQKCLEGKIDQDMAFAIGDEELEQGLRLICIGSPPLRRRARRMKEIRTTRVRALSRRKTPTVRAPAGSPTGCRVLRPGPRGR